MTMLANCQGCGWISFHARHLAFTLTKNYTVVRYRIAFEDC